MNPIYIIKLSFNTNLAGEFWNPNSIFNMDVLGRTPHYSLFVRFSLKTI